MSRGSTPSAVAPALPPSSRGRAPGADHLLRGNARRRHDDTRCELDLLDKPDLRDEVARVAEALGREPDLLLVVERDAAAHELVDLVRDRIRPYGEEELLGRRARHRYHRHLAFPGLADP